MLYIILLVVFLTGCVNISELLPNKARDEYYMTHGPSFYDHVYKVNIGMTKTEIVVQLGEPTEIRKNGDWMYHFPEDGIQKFCIRFKDDKVVNFW